MIGHRKALFWVTALGLGALALSCGSSSRSGSAAGTTTGGVAPGSSGTTPGVLAGSPVLVSASWRDADGSGGVTAGDVVLLGFDREVVLQAPDPARDLALVAGDTAGAGASLIPGATGKEVLLVLGPGVNLSLFGTYGPGRAPGPGSTPATLALASGRKLDALVSATADPAADAPPVQILAEDPDTAPAYQGRPFLEPALSAATVRYGNLHAHTGFSDGQLDPEQAHAHARVTHQNGAGGLDFMSTSDHLEQLSAYTWGRTQQMASAADTPGSYVALQGFEWGHGWIPPLNWYNHINVIGTTQRVSLLDTMTPTGLYREALAHCYPEGAIGIFNHPYISKPPLVYSMWDDFRYDGAADKLMVMIDCEGNGSRQTAALGFLPALAKGWHLSPGSNQDNHSANWGDANDRRNGVWLEQLDRPSLLRALRQGRTFSTSDRNASMRLIANGRLWMGSTVTGSGPVALRVELDDADGEPWTRIDIVSNGNVVASQASPGVGPLAFEVTVDPQVDAYFFAQAVQQDGDELFSTPIYVDR